MNKIAVVYSSYYKDVVDGLLDGIKNTIHESFNLDYFKVPGSWDIVYKTNTLSKEYKIFIAVGIICKGDTDHYEYISSSVANGLINLTINKDLYIANCILNTITIVSLYHSILRKKLFVGEWTGGGIKTTD